jgi:polysaccharide pyruvyl transferase WcaK-like protein
MIDRREFFSAALATAAASAAGRAPRILLRNSWAIVNIGDIAHTPGILALLEKYIPNAEVRLWPSTVANGVDEILMRRFPKLTILKSQPAIKTAIEECDFFLHGSGASLVAQKDLTRWRQETSKPYGIYGITNSSTDPKTIDHFNNARFVYFRDSVSLELSRKAGARPPVMGFAPDSAFATDLRNDAEADTFLHEHRLETGKFLCCIPRYRLTPSWKMVNRKAPFDETRQKRNEEMKEHDHAPLRAAIEAVISKTKMKVLICPEDETQMELGKEMVFDKLSAGAKKQAVWHEKFWMTDVAVSTYVRSAGLFGNEMHSPIMCIGNGIPAIVCRFADQTSKGIMWRDIGLGEWLFDLDVESEVARIAPAVLAMAQNPGAAKRKAAAARVRVEKLQRESMQVVAKSLPAV